ncbi:NO-inducible flavohemoprotein [Metabacillus sp. 84]|uniref:NO-inducible flavohemoprotein n=1 Tax=Metabacillus sp. 84 TaxID=3404705 RepID=UPI003CF6E3A5
MLNEKTKQLVKSTVPALMQHGLDITASFYKNMFNDHPDLLNLFNQSNQKQGRQQAALAQAVLAAAANIDRLEAILPAVEKIAHKHRSLGVKKEHYPIVGDYLLKAMKEILQEKATDEILSAWEEAYGVIAGVFIQAEEELYASAENQNGGWSGFKAFRVIKKVKESSVITSFYLAPADDRPIPHFLPGQYVTIRVKPPGEEYWHNRQYSLSNAPGTGCLRISVKKEENGTVSAYLHEHIHAGSLLEASPPAGDFVLIEQTVQPATFISGGVGTTPFLSMLHRLAETQPEKPVQYIHAAQNEEVHAFKDEINGILQRMPNSSAAIFYENRQGRISAERLHRTLETTAGDFYVCGPIPFMEVMIAALHEMGIPDNRIHYEFFGPAASIKRGQSPTLLES